MGRLECDESGRRPLAPDGLVADPFGHVIWLGGISAVGKTTAARRLARRYDLGLYSLDEHLHEHRRRLGLDERPPDLEWLTAGPGEIAAEFEALARLRFPFVVEDVSALPADAPVIAEGHALLPDLVAPLLADRRRALYVVAPTKAQLGQIEDRGDAVHLRTRNPERALENRLARDALLARALRRGARTHGLRVAVVSSAAETERVVARWLEPLIAAWVASADHGDVAARRRAMNDARLGHVRALPLEGRGDRLVKLSCECSRSGCVETIVLPMAEVERRRAAGGAFVSREHG